MSQPPAETTAALPPTIPPPLDEAGAGPGWIVMQYLLHAVAGVFSRRVLLLSAAGLVLAELGAWACVGFRAEGWSALASPTGGAVSESLAPGQLISSAGATQIGFWWAFAAPYWEASPSVSEAALKGLAGGWRLVVWSLFGVAIARLAALHLAHHESPKARAVLRRSFGGWLGQAMGPLVMLLATGLLAAPIWLMGAASQWSAASVVAAVLWPVAIGFALAASLVAIGVAVGAPLMWASHAVEQPDPFDAVSCGIAYVYQRPLRLLAYVLQAAIVGAVSGAMLLGVLRVGFGVLETYFLAADGAEGTPFGRWMINAWLTLYDYLPTVFHAGYFWFASVAVYLLMRRDIDEKQVDEVFIDHDQPDT